MTNEIRKKLDEAQRLIEEVEQEIGKVAEQQLANGSKQALMFASIELGAVSALRKALEALG